MTQYPQQHKRLSRALRSTLLDMARETLRRLREEERQRREDEALPCWLRRQAQ